MRIGILTGGGDAPGLNGIIEASTRTLLKLGHEVVGIIDGFEGIFQKRYLPLTMDQVRGKHAFAGTLLGASNKSGTQGREKEFQKAYDSLNLDGLIVAGGDGTFRSLQELKKLPIIAVPKTIDNDLPGTDTTFGYDTACHVVSQAIDNLRATAVAHKRMIIVETMGRTAGWIALGGGMASMADAILIPEKRFEPEKFQSFLEEKLQTQRGIIIVASEGVTIESDITRGLDLSAQSEVVANYGIAEKLSQWVEATLNWETRHVVLGHLQRSHPPSTTDRFLTTAMGVVAARLAHRKEWGQAAIFKNGQIIPAPLSQIMGSPRTIPSGHRWLKMAEALGLYI